MISESTLRRVADLYPWLPRGSSGLAAHAHECLALELDEGTVVFDVGQPCSGFPLVLDGRVRVVRPAVDGSEIFLYRVTPGRLCSMSTLALLGDRPYRARAIAETRVEAVGIPSRLMRELLQRDDVRGTVVDSLADHIERLMGRLEEVSRLSVDQRLAARLCEEGQVIGTTHQALADDLDCSREIVSRVLERFQRDGFVRLGRARIELLDRGGLERLARPVERL